MRFRVWNTSSLVILTACYDNTAVFCSHPDSRLHKYGRILYTSSLVILTAHCILYNEYSRILFCRRDRGACALILSRSESGRPYKYIKGPSLAQPPPLHWAADGALTGRQRGVSRASFGPQRLTAPARATACCAAAPPRGCCSQRRSDGPLLVEQRRPEGAARAGRPRVSCSPCWR